MSKQPEKNISEKIAELERVVAWFEGDEFTLEEATETFVTAQKLAASIEEDLTSLKNDIEVVKQKFDESA
jgi:exodeoxyribonuclease VII small subunit